MIKSWLKDHGMIMAVAVFTSTLTEEVDMDMQSYWTFGISWFALAALVILSSCYIKNKAG